MTVEELYALPVNGDGWRVLANGNWVKLGDGVTLGDEVTLGNRVTLGDEVTLGNRVKLGNGVTLGDGVTLGNRVTLGDEVTLGDGVTLGGWVKLGNGVKLGDGVTCRKTPVQVQCNPYIVYPYSPTEIGVGCIVHPVSYWIRAKDPDELQEHPECKPWAVYREAIALVAKHLGDLEQTL